MTPRVQACLVARRPPTLVAAVARTPLWLTSTLPDLSRTHVAYLHHYYSSAEHRRRASRPNHDCLNSALKEGSSQLGEEFSLHVRFSGFTQKISGIIQKRHRKFPVFIKLGWVIAPPLYGPAQAVYPAGSLKITPAANSLHRIADVDVYPFRRNRYGTDTSCRVD